MSDPKFEKADLVRKQSKINRRDFIRTGMRAVAFLSLGSVAGYSISKTMKDDLVWQIDPTKCVQCGRCAYSCVMNLSAVKCMHVHKICGYCDLCGGYFKPQVKQLDTAAEHQLCPTKALKRTFVEPPYYKYDVIEELCNGCGKCVEGCGAFGNGSLQLQINQKICVQCNQCSIAQICPSEAIVRIPRNKAYMLRKNT